MRRRGRRRPGPKADGALMSEERSGRHGWARRRHRRPRGLSLAPPTPGAPSTKASAQTRLTDAAGAADGLTILVCLLVLARRFCEPSRRSRGRDFRNVPPPGESSSPPSAVPVAQVGFADLQQPLARVCWLPSRRRDRLSLVLAIGRSRAASGRAAAAARTVAADPGGGLDTAVDPDVPSSELSMMSITFVGALFPTCSTRSTASRASTAGWSPGAQPWHRPAGDVPPGDPARRRAQHRHGPGDRHGHLLVLPCLAEMISGQFGIGYYTWESYTLQNYGGIVVGMLVIGLLGMGCSALIRLAAGSRCRGRRGAR